MNEENATQKGKISDKRQGQRKSQRGKQKETKGG